MSTTQPTGLICIECNRAMRRRGVKAADAPNTVASGHSGKCNSCISAARYRDNASEETVQEKDKLPKAEDPVRMSETVSALETWMAWRRGSNRESTNPIKYQPDAVQEQVAA